MTMHATFRKAALTALVAVPVVLAAQLPAAQGAPSTRLQAFGSCGELLRYAKKHAMPQVGPYGLGGVIGVGLPVAVGAERAAADSAVAGVDYSTTNVQEAGVDEPDLVKTDGATLYAVAQGKLRAVDVRGRKPALLDTLALGPSWSHDLLLEGDRLLVISRGATDVVPLPGARESILPPQRQQTTLTEIDVSVPPRLRIVRTLTVDGAYLSARLVGQYVRVVVSAPMPSALPFPAPSGQPFDEKAAVARNRAIVAASKARAWLPSLTIVNRRTGRKTTQGLVQCRNVMRPLTFSGLGTLTVFTIDLRKGLEPVDADAVMTDGQVVYGSQQSLYVATQRWASRPDPSTSELVPDGFRTEVHKFDIAQGPKTEYRGSGSVSGMLLNQWSLSEHAGVLRVASTDQPVWWGGAVQRESESFVTTLREHGGKLVEVGRVGGLGRGERIYSVRFMGDTGYVVTFRQVDPLYTLDLADPARPRVLGELKIQGFSSYLHPVGEDLLLGVGQDATTEGRVTGSQLSLFDVSDLLRPDRLHQALLGAGRSEAEYDHHAFLYWPLQRLVVLPLQTYAVKEGDTWFGGVIAFRVTRGAGIQELGRIAHPATDIPTGGAPQVQEFPIRRSIVVRDTLLTVSEGGVRATALAGFGDAGWLPFS